jgi:hypothetical protein
LPEGSSISSNDHFTSTLNDSQNIVAQFPVLESYKKSQVTQTEDYTSTSHLSLCKGIPRLRNKIFDAFQRGKALYHWDYNREYNSWHNPGCKKIISEKIMQHVKRVCSQMQN